MLSLRLCQILTEKIFHDFAGTIGVIDNSVSLITSKHHPEKAVSLLQSGTNKLVESLRFYRYLYSRPSANTIDIIEINKLSVNFLKLQSNNIQLIFQGFPPTIQDKIGKMIMCFILLASDYFKKDGTIKIALATDNNTIKIMIADKQLQFDKDKIDILLGQGNMNDIDIGNVHEYYTHYLITESGYKLEVSPAAGSIEYILTRINLTNK